jgi:squalene-associated FAD-dependent desaturase
VDRDAHALARALTPAMGTMAVVGAGWAGLAAAVHATRAGHAVTLFEMSREAGGRAREVTGDAYRLDNGQHLLIGAYREVLALMRCVGVDPDEVLLRRPLTLVNAQGRGLRLAPGAPVPTFVRAVLRHPGWTPSHRWALLRTALAWRLKGFEAPEALTVAGLTAHLPEPVRRELIDPLCVAALNTPADRASARVFLRVLRDGLFGGVGGSDLLLPRRSLSDLLPTPALNWLTRHGATVRLGQRVTALHADANGIWNCNGEAFDAVILASTAVEAARLTADVAPAWSARAAAFSYEPIVTVYLKGEGPPWPDPMIALSESPQAPAQFAIDLGACDPAKRGLHAFVISGAAPWVARGLPATTDAVLSQAQATFPAMRWTPARTLAERRATFLCTPGLLRPPGRIAPGLWAAGDYVAGPYPATLEGAVRSGAAAAAQLRAD